MGEANTSRPFLFVDGEGGDCADGSHAYMVLCGWSKHTGKLILRNDDGSPLRSGQILDWLLALSARLKAEGNPHTIIGFGLGYDIAMWLKDLPWRPAERLFRPDLAKHLDAKGQAKWVSWGPYIMKQVGSQFTVCETWHGWFARATKESHGHFCVWDVWKFFQGSFVKALRDWKILPPVQLDHMQSMKAKRSTFQANEIDHEIIAYCFSECQAGVALMSKLDQTCRDLGFPLAGQYHGAGSLAGAMLRAWGTKAYMADVPQEMAEAVACAYAGGRFQNRIFGHYQVPLWQADLNSAYPTIIKNLPCLAHADWEESTEVEQWGLYEVEWDLPKPCLFGTLPYRNGRGEITYPRRGRGWHWGSEILAAERLYPGCHTVRRGWKLIRRCNHVPFAEVPNVYQQRLILGAEAGGIVLKLGLNSLYGKTAQSVGTPTFANYIWAGMITAGCRAMILDGIRLVGPSHVLAIATDAIYTDVAPTVLPSTVGEKRLGEWTVTPIAGGALFIMPGIAIYYDGEGNASYKSRGLGKKEFASHTEAAVDAWNAKGIRARFTARTHRFIGPKMALARNDYEQRCRWVTVELSLSFMPTHRVPQTAIDLFAHKRRIPAWTVEQEGKPEEPSAPYKLIHRRLTNDGFDKAQFISEQPAVECDRLALELAS